MQPASPFAHLTFFLFVVMPLVLEPTLNAAVVFLAASMLLAAAGLRRLRDQRPGQPLVLHHRDQLFCPLFATLDLLGRRRPSAPPQACSTDSFAHSGSSGGGQFARVTRANVLQRLASCSQILYHPRVAG